MILSRPSIKPEFFSDVKQVVKEQSQGYSNEDYSKLERRIKALESECKRLLKQNIQLIADNEEIRCKLQPIQVTQPEVTPHSEDFTVEALLSENNALRNKLDNLNIQLRNSVVGKDENFQCKGEVYKQVYKTNKSGVLLISQEYLESLLCKV